MTDNPHYKVAVLFSVVALVCLSFTGGMVTYGATFDTEAASVTAATAANFPTPTEMDMNTTKTDVTTNNTTAVNNTDANVGNTGINTSLCVGNVGNTGCTGTTESFVVPIQIPAVTTATRHML